MKSLSIMSNGTCSSACMSPQFNVPCCSSSFSSSRCLFVALKQQPRGTPVRASRGGSYSSSSKGRLGGVLVLVEVKALSSVQQPQPGAALGRLGVVRHHPHYCRDSFTDSSSEFFRTCVWTYGNSCCLSLAGRRDATKRSLTIVAGKKGKKAERDHHVLVKEREEDLDEEKKDTTTAAAATTCEDEESTKGKKKLNKAKKKQDPQENGGASAAAEDRITKAQLKSKKKELKEMFQKNDVLLRQLKKKADEEEEEEEDSPEEQLVENHSDDVVNGTLRRRDSDSKLQDNNKHKDKKKLKSKAKTHEDSNDNKEEEEEEEKEEEEEEEASGAKEADGSEIEMKGKEKTRKLMRKLKKPHENSSIVVADQNADLKEKMEATTPDEFADGETFQEFKDTDPLANVIENEFTEELDELRLDDDEFWEDDSKLEPEVGDGGEGGGVLLGDTPWGQTVLDLTTDVLAEFKGDIAIFAFKVSKESGVIRVRLDKLSDKYGSPTIDEIQQFSSSYSKSLEQAGEAGIVPKNLALEVSSPGAERVLHIPQDLERFKKLPMYIRYVDGGEDTTETAEAEEKDGILELESVDTETGTSVWKLANVRINRELVSKGRGLNKKKRKWRLQLPCKSIVLVRLYINL